MKQSKIKIDQKEINIYNQPNISLFTHKKPKHYSIDKNMNNTNNINNISNINNIIHKKITRNNKINNENINKKSNSSMSTITPRCLSQTNNSLFNETKTKNASEKEVILSNNTNNISETINIPKIKDLSPKENAYLILSYSKCLRLCERMIFSRSTSKLRESISKKQVFEINKIYLNEKIKELVKKIEDCDDKLNNKFNASKTAEMTLNFITSNFENEFRLNLFQNVEDEEEKKYYYNYIKMLYLLLDENYDQIKNENLIRQLYQRIINKGYKNIKDYLYYIYIKNLKENRTIENINKINELLVDSPDLLTFNHTLDSNRFIVYSCYLFKEIINFANEKIDTFKLKNDCINLIDVINNKLNLYNEKNIK